MGGKSSPSAAPRNYGSGGTGGAMLGGGAPAQTPRQYAPNPFAQQGGGGSGPTPRTPSRPVQTAISAALRQRGGGVSPRVPAAPPPGGSEQWNAYRNAGKGPELRQYAQQYGTSYDPQARLDRYRPRTGGRFTRGGYLRNM